MKRASSRRNIALPRPWSFCSRSLSSAGSAMVLPPLRPSGRGGRRGQLSRRRLHRLDDILIAGAPAQIAGHAVTDLLLARAGIFLQQPVGTHQHARCAVAALQAVLLVEGLLQGMQDAADRKSTRLNSSHMSI